ncbi:hypothetical protein DNTS_015396 [Danionella cerebrum]|uniref:Dickkopf-related protein 1/2/4 C-terminal subdomain 1 domain-containing protein n=1 Tax=Danionella cerebrum TaxID=2873325 RepID=A0A553R3R0_9TELE|nr:hypothetical protein DNTS_015396 [Danionella translucida]
MLRGGFVIFWLFVIPALRCLDSNTIHSSRESSSSQESEEHLRSRPEASFQNHVRRSSAPLGMRSACVSEPGTACKDSRTKPFNASRAELHGPQKVSEMSPCVRSRDCAEGLCCALYLTGRRCQRVPALGEVCLLRGRAKMRRRLDRCDCQRNLSCRPRPESPRGQGVCQPDQLNTGFRPV